MTDLAVGAPYDDDGGYSNYGAVYILILNADGTVSTEHKMSATAVSSGQNLVSLHLSAVVGH